MGTQERTSTLMKCDDQLVIWMAIDVIMRIVMVVMILILITMEVIVMMTLMVIFCDQYIMLVMPWRSCV